MSTTLSTDRPRRGLRGGYAVVPLAKFFEVRWRVYDHGDIHSDQLVAVFPDEREADATARALSKTESRGPA